MTHTPYTFNDRIIDNSTNLKEEGKHFPNPANWIFQWEAKDRAHFWNLEEELYDIIVHPNFHFGGVQKLTCPWRFSVT